MWHFGHSQQFGISSLMMPSDLPICRRQFGHFRCERIKSSGGTCSRTESKHTDLQTAGVNDLITDGALHQRQTELLLLGLHRVLLPRFTARKTDGCVRQHRLEEDDMVTDTCYSRLAHAGERTLTVSCHVRVRCVRLYLPQCTAWADTTASSGPVHQTSSCLCRSGTRRTQSACRLDSAGNVSVAAAPLPAPYCQTSPLHSTDRHTQVSRQNKQRMNWRDISRIRIKDLLMVLRTVLQLRSWVYQSTCHLEASTGLLTTELTVSLNTKWSTGSQVCSNRIVTDTKRKPMCGVNSRKYHSPSERYLTYYLHVMGCLSI